MFPEFNRIAKKLFADQNSMITIVVSAFCYGVVGTEFMAYNARRGFVINLLCVILCCDVASYQKALEVCAEGPLLLAYCAISINSAGRYMPAEILNSARGGNDRYKHFFSADFYDFFAIF